MQLVARAALPPEAGGGREARLGAPEAGSQPEVERGGIQAGVDEGPPARGSEPPPSPAATVERMIATPGISAEGSKITIPFRVLYALRPSYTIAIESNRHKC